MKSKKNEKKTWKKPEIKTLSIKKDTFSGSGTVNESAKKRPPI